MDTIIYCYTSSSFNELFQYDRSETPFEYRVTPFILFLRCCHTCTYPPNKDSHQVGPCETLCLRDTGHITWMMDKAESIHL